MNTAVPEVTVERRLVRVRVEQPAQFADERSKAIRLKVLQGELKVHSSISETGESEETIPIEYDGQEVEIGFNAQYLLDFLAVVDNGGRVRLELKDEQSAGQFRPGEDEVYKYRYVVMPMRV